MKNEKDLQNKINADLDFLKPLFSELDQKIEIPASISPEVLKAKLDEPISDIISLEEKRSKLTYLPKVVSLASVFAIVLIGSVYFSRFASNGMVTNESAVYDVTSSTAIAEATAEEGYDSYSMQDVGTDNLKENVNGANTETSAKGTDAMLEPEEVPEMATEEECTFAPNDIASNGYLALDKKLSEISELYRYNGFIEVSQALYSKTQEIKSTDGNINYKVVYEDGSTTIFVYDVKNSSSPNLLAKVKCDGMYSNIFTLENSVYIMCESSVFNFISNKNGDFPMDIIPCFYMEDSKTSSKTILTNKQITIMKNTATPTFTTILGIHPTSQSVDITAFATLGKVDNFTINKNVLTLTNNGAEVVLSLDSDRISLISNK